MKQVEVRFQMEIIDIKHKIPAGTDSLVNQKANVQPELVVWIWHDGDRNY